MSDEFARLRAIAAGQEADVKKWKYERDGNVMGTIVEFSSLKNKTYGEQQTVIVKLADTGELVSAFLSCQVSLGCCDQSMNRLELIG